MKDIDFDELDKAVNSLMGGVKIKSDRPEAKTLTLTTTLKEGEQPEYDKIQHAAEKIGSETLLSPMEKTAIITGTLEDQVNVLSLSDKPLEPLTLDEVVAPVVAASVAVQKPATPLPVSEPVEMAPKAVPAKAPSGRFMDVMHPSSDMKTAQVTTPSTVVVSTPLATPTQAAPPSIVVPSRPVKSVEVQPEVVTEQPIEPPRLETPSPAPVATTPPVLVVPIPAEVTPEVFEHASVEASPQIVEVPTPTVVELDIKTPNQELASPVIAESIEQIEPLSSPFLPDAKVEKRPLGGAIDTSHADEMDINSLDTPYAIDNSADTQLSPTGANQSVLPDELHNELLAIETNLADDSQIQATSNETETSSATTNDVASEIAQVNNTSVSDDSTDDTPENGAIFDTTNYHKTVSHPAKRTSEWVWIAVIVGIILVCAAGAAAFYLLSSQ